VSKLAQEFLEALAPPVFDLFGVHLTCRFSTLKALRCSSTVKITS